MSVAHSIFRGLQESPYNPATFIEIMNQLPSYADKVKLLTLESSKHGASVFRASSAYELRSAGATTMFVDLVITHDCPHPRGVVSETPSFSMMLLDPDGFP